MNCEFQLPQRIEELLEAAKKGLENLSIREIKELLRALETRRSHLEIENKDLRVSLEKLETLRDKFTNLFEFDPVASLFTDETGQPDKTVTLSENQDRLDQILRDANIGTWDLNVQAGRLVASPYCAEMLGYPPAEIKPHIRDWLGLINPEDRSKILISWRNHTKGHSPVFFSEQRFRTRDGHWRWFCIRGKISRRDETGTALRAMGTFQDVTDRKLNEDARRKHESRLMKLEKTESLSILAGGVAHDFNNLLMVISGNAELGLMETPKDSPLRESLEEIKRASLRAAHLSNQMRAYSGQGHAVLVKADLNELLEEHRPLLVDSVGKKVVLKFNLAKEKLDIEADTMQIQQAVTNLVTNAVESLDNTARIVTVRTGRVEATKDYLAEMNLDEDIPPGEYVFLEVADTGCGMPSEIQEKIFDPFFTTKFIGRGLGLGVVLGIVRGHGGAISVKSQPGAGATFRILLPAAPQEQITPSMEYLPVEEPEMGMILIVDDEEAIVHLTKLMLEREGLDVVTAESGQRAVDLFQLGYEDISVVLLDISMPGMSGEETFRQLRKIRDDITIFVCSGLGDEKVIQSFAQQGCNGFLQKPFNFNKLIKIIRKSGRKYKEKGKDSKKFSL